MPSTDFCICVCVFGCRLSLFRLCDSDFGITPADIIIIIIIIIIRRREPLQPRDSRIPT